MFFNAVDTPSTHRDNRTLPSDKAGLKPIAPGKYNIRHVGNEGSGLRIQNICPEDVAPAISNQYTYDNEGAHMY
jgi:hypothetical protein